MNVSFLYKEDEAKIASSSFINDFFSAEMISIIGRLSSSFISGIVNNISSLGIGSCKFVIVNPLFNNPSV